MSTYATNLTGRQGRWPAWLLEIETGKRCGNTRAVAPCTAAAGSDGARCYYNPFGCDTGDISVDFTPSTFTWRFWSVDVPIPRLVLEQYALWDPLESTCRHASLSIL